MFYKTGKCYIDRIVLGLIIPITVYFVFNMFRSKIKKREAQMILILNVSSHLLLLKQPQMNKKVFKCVWFKAVFKENLCVNNNVQTYKKSQRNYDPNDQSKYLLKQVCVFFTISWVALISNYTTTYFYLFKLPLIIMLHPVKQLQSKLQPSACCYLST